MCEPTPVSWDSKCHVPESLVAAMVDAGWAIPPPPRHTPSPNEPAVAADGCFVGIDLGGSKIHAVVHGAQTGCDLAEVVQPTDKRGREHVVDQIVGMVRELTRGGHLSRVVLGGPGVPSASNGSLHRSHNLAGSERYPVLPALVTALGVEVGLENDVNLAAWAEHAWTGETELALISVGTGVGIGLIVRGAMYTGATGAAGEVDWLPIVSQVPGGGHALESLLSGRGIVDTYGRLGGQQSTTRKILDTRRSDPLAEEAVTAFCEQLASLALIVGALTDPQAVVLGGGIGSRPDVVDLVQRLLRTHGSRGPSMRASHFGPRAGAMGALFRAMQEPALAPQ